MNFDKYLIKKEPEIIKRFYFSSYIDEGKLII
jgi:glutathione peroxidase-family protein